jgi:hypothetical protein
MDRKGDESQKNDKNNNDPQKPDLVQASPGSPMGGGGGGGEETTCASSVEEESRSTVLQAVINNHHDHPPQRQALLLTNQITQLAIASGGSMLVLILATVPIPILVGMIIVLAIWFRLLVKLYQRAILEYQNLVQGRGVSQYLPESMTSSLIHTSIHDWMMDPSFMQEHAYLALYFIPGINAQQMELYVNQLLPRHQQLLRRPGLGHLLGNDFMRLLVGENRGGNQNQGAAMDDGVSAGMVPRRLELLSEHHHHDAASQEEDPSDLDPDDPESQYARFFGLEPGNGDEPQYTTPMASAVVTEATFETEGSQDEHDKEDKSDNDNDAEDPTLEMTILTDAVSAGINNYYNMAYDMAVDSAVSVTTVLTRTIITRTSWTLTLVGAGIATLGLLAGVYDLQGLWQSMPFLGGDRPSGQRLVSFPSSSLLMSTTLASAGTASLMMMFGWRVGSNDNDNNKKSQHKKDKSA